MTASWSVKYSSVYVKCLVRSSLLPSTYITYKTWSWPHVCHFWVNYSSSFEILLFCLQALKTLRQSVDFFRQTSSEHKAAEAHFRHSINNQLMKFFQTKSHSKQWSHLMWIGPTVNVGILIQLIYMFMGFKGGKTSIYVSIPQWTPCFLMVAVFFLKFQNSARSNGLGGLLQRTQWAHHIPTGPVCQDPSPRAESRLNLLSPLKITSIPKAFFFHCWKHDSSPISRPSRPDDRTNHAGLCE